MAEKWCPKCETMKDEEDFPVRNDLKSGRGYWCKDCHRLYREDWLKTRPNYGREHYAKNDEIKKAHIRKMSIGRDISKVIMEALLSHTLEKGYKLDRYIKSIIQSAVDASVLSVIDPIIEQGKVLLDELQRQKVISHEVNKKKPKIITPSKKSKDNIVLLLESARRGDLSPPSNLSNAFCYIRNYKTSCKEFSEFIDEIEKTTDWMKRKKSGRKKSGIRCLSANKKHPIPIH
jgi:hypothetical protein